MSDFDIKKIDKKTLEFAIEKAWCFRFLTKNTKAGRIEAAAYQRVEDTLTHYLKSLSD